MDRTWIALAILLPLALLLAMLLAARRRRPESARPAAPAEARPAVDMSFLQSQFGDSPEVIAELLLEFQNSLAESSRLLRAACEGGLVEPARSEAHKLKSASLALGAQALGGLCEDIERAARLPGGPELAEVWPRFEAEAAAVDRFIGGLLRAHPEWLEAMKERTQERTKERQTE